ncbi:BatD family protein [Croceiramulus getboli]|nr:BatD family protein [Flavobacteriaceae bacterium YJPT1-3]
MSFKYYVLAAFLWIAGSVAAQVEFTAQVSKSSLGINERLRVDFQMNQNGDNFRPPNFEGFDVVGGPNQSISNSYINGKRSFSKTFSYFLAPKQRGTLTIGQAEIQIDGEIYKTTPVQVTVTGAVDQPRDPNDPAVIAADNIHLVAEVSKTNPYLNEALTVVYKLYVAPDTGVSNWRELDSPKYADFWSQTIDQGQQQKVMNGTYQGREYRYVVLRKTVLYPQKSGKLEIEPLALDVTVEVPTNRRDIFGTRFTKTEHLTVAANKRTINVKPLPTAGRPENFSGAVGSFDFEVKTDKKSLASTEAFNLEVKVSGNGNLKLFELPNFNLPSSLEVYEPEHTERVRTNLSGMTGVIEDRYTVVPQFKGSYPIPALSFAYFDLKTESYKTLSSEEIVIEVLSGPEENSTAVASTPGGTAKQKVTGGNQLLYIKSSADFEPIDEAPFFKTTLYWALLGAPLLLIPLALLIGKRRKAYLDDTHGLRIRRADKLARKYLSDAKRNMGDQKAFYIAMEKALHNYLKAKLNIQTSEMSKERISRLLQERDVKDSDSIEFISLLESCEFARYTPTNQVGMQQDYDKAVRVVSNLDKQLR